MPESDKQKYLVVVKRTFLTRWAVETETTAKAGTLACEGRGEQVDADQAPEEIEVDEVWNFASDVGPSTRASVKSA